jgi:hypothetical protein
MTIHFRTRFTENPFCVTFSKRLILHRNKSVSSDRTI